MWITWITFDANVPSIVEYGTSPWVYTSSSLGGNNSYSYVLYDSSEIHHVVIGPLEANKIYFHSGHSMHDGECLSEKMVQVQTSIIRLKLRSIRCYAWFLY